MASTYKEREITEILKQIRNKRMRQRAKKIDQLLVCKGCGNMFSEPEFYYSQSKLRQAVCPNCGRNIINW